MVARVKAPGEAWQTIGRHAESLTALSWQLAKMTDSHCLRGEFRKWSNMSVLATYWPPVYGWRVSTEDTSLQSPPSLQTMSRSNSNHSLSLLLSDAKVSLCSLSTNSTTPDCLWLSLSPSLHDSGTCCLSQIDSARAKSIQAVHINTNILQSSAA